MCTIGGNVAENSGGAHCLKHGFTAHHVTGVTLVLPDGEAVELGGKALDPDGPDLLGVVVGSEGTLGIVTRVTLRLVRLPEAVQTLLAGFETTDAAGAAVSGIIAGGILPSALEMMDRLTIEAAELAVAPGYPAGAGAVLLVELDGVAAQVDEDAAEVERICAECGAFEIRAATNDLARALLWKGRRSAFAAMGRVATDYYVQDGVVPRTRLPEVLRRIEELSEIHGLRVGNVFHAGDGNLHPLVLYDAEQGETEQARLLAEAILDACLDAGGSLTGEHGVGMDKACSMPQDVLRARPRGLRAAAASVRSTGALQSRKGDSRRRVCAARCRARIACTRSRGWALPSVSSLEQAAEALAAAHREGRQLTIGDDLTTEGLDRILEHEAGDLTCTVEAGVRLSVLQRALGEHGQRLSLDPPGDPTVGALLARNLSGPLRHRFGAPRDLVLGVTLVLADGTIASAGGKVVKNVAGYDLARLVCGSEGRLALIARVSLRLHPLPKAARTLAVETDDAASALSMLLRSQLQPSALDVLHPGRHPRALRGLSSSGRGADRSRAESLVGGVEVDAEAWDVSRRRQAEARGRCPLRSRRSGRDARESSARPLSAPPPVSPTRPTSFQVTVCYKERLERSCRAHPARARSERSSRRVIRELTADCVHCGFCLPTCPTYVLWNEEMDSPRGRIHLMDARLDEAVTLNDTVTTHFDRCLGCMACVSSCPSGVRYDRLIESTRAAVEDEYERPLGDRILRGLLFRVLPYPGRMRTALALAPLGKSVPLPRRFRPLVEVAPPWRGRGEVPSVTQPEGVRRGRVGLLTGCVQRAVFSDVNAATARVLAADGYEVAAPPQGCCGALSIHAGRAEEGKAFARALITAFEDVEVVVVNSSGCGSHLKELGWLLGDERASDFAAKVRDVGEFLAEIRPRHGGTRCR